MLAVLRFFMRFTRFSLILVVPMLLLSSCNQRKQEAINNFRQNHSQIEMVVQFMEKHPGIDYVEFKTDDRVDLSILDKEKFDPDSGFAVFKYDLFGVPVESIEVINALRYAGMSMEQFMKLKKLLSDAACISVQKTFFQRSAIVYEVGYRRDSMSKWLYAKWRTPVSLENNKGHLPLTANWTLDLASPAFN